MTESHSELFSERKSNVFVNLFSSLPSGYRRQFRGVEQVLLQAWAALRLIARLQSRREVLHESKHAQTSNFFFIVVSKFWFAFK